MSFYSIRLIYRSFSIIVGVFFLYVIFNLFTKSGEISLLSYFKVISPFKMAISIGAYLFSHFLRSVRMGLMIGQQNFSFIKLINRQFYTNGINLVLPFKIGEFYRIVEFGKLFKNPEKTFLTILAERSMDFLFLFAGLFVALYFTDYSLLNLRVTVLIGAMFITTALLVYYVLPENLRSFNLFLAKRYTKKSITKILSISYRLYTLISRIKVILKKKSSSIVLLTSLIWFSEIAGLFFITEYLELRYVMLLAFFVFLSSLIPSASLGFGSLQVAFYLISIVKPDFPYLALSMIYQVYIFLPAIIISLVLYVLEKRNEWRTSKLQITNI